MSSIRKMERDRLLAELASLDGLIASMSDEDVVMKFSLEDRKEEIRREVEQIDIPEEHTASVALFFGGLPVVGQRGIESQFAGAAVSKFQDLVSKLLVTNVGELGQRGPVPNKSASTMHITNLVRGSFGFLMEELQTQGQMVDTALRGAVDEASRLMAAFGSTDDEEFEAAAEEVDERVLATAGELFGLLHDSGATLRLVAGQRDDAFGLDAVERARSRATSTIVTEDPEIFEGKLTGVLPEGHLFELQRDGGDIVRGRVDRSVSTAQLLEWNRTMLFVDAVVVTRVRRVRKDGNIVRESYILSSLELRDPAAGGDDVDID